LTKKEMIRRIAAQYGIDQTITRKIVQQCLDTIIDVIAEKGRIELRNFGVFEVKQRSQRKARNPRTGEEVLVPARRVLTFQPGKNIAKRIQNTPPPAG